MFMPGLFGFMDMAGNYESRKVDRYEDEKHGLAISTCSVTDSDDPYETAVMHPGYNDGEWVIVETYQDKEAAQEGHNRWVKTMTEGELPAHLQDVSICETAKLVDSFASTEEEKDWRRKERKA